VEAVLSTAAGVLNVLLDGPRYGRELIRLLSARARGTVNPRPGTVYRTFESLVRKGYVRSWTVVPGGRRGARARRYYDLTPKGIAVAESQREALAELLGFPASRPSSADAQLMSARLHRAAEVSAFTLKLQRAVRQASGRRP
jgi:DNA-binding PadR family transcriptional regulator